jgi:hypothetical protein
VRAVTRVTELALYLSRRVGAGLTTDSGTQVRAQGE